MKIRRVVARRIDREMAGGLRNPQMTWTTKSIVLAFVETDSGVLGVGEGWTAAGSPDALVRTIEEELAPLVVGEDPFFVTRIWERAYQRTVVSARRGIVSSALGAVDTALWDLIGRITGTPLYRLLGAAAERVRCYASAGLYGPGKTPADLGAEAADYVRRGFSDVKIKVGGASLEEDVARVEALRAALGRDGRLMVDAVGSLDVPRALRLARALAPYDVYWLESPVHPDDIAGQARVNLRGPIPVCGNEAESGRERFRELIAARAVEYVQFDIAACGGITEARRIADLAAAHRLPVTLHAASSAVLLAASLHLAAALPHCDSVEYHMLHQWLAERAPPGSFAVEGGFVRPPERPGLGIDLHYEGLS